MHLRLRRRFPTLETKLLEQLLYMQRNRRLGERAHEMLCSGQTCRRSYTQ
jgi:hypothetical protein